MVAVRVVMEGGGDDRSGKTELRASLSAFIKKALGACDMPKIIAAGGRDMAFKTFKSVANENPDEFIILLVDSEDAVTEKDSTWQHLKKRDNWDRPANAADEQAHMMVRCMEAWFLADRAALSAYFDKGFNENALPKTANIEDIERGEAAAVISRAAKETRKKQYSKSDGLKILGLIDPAKVQHASCHAKAFLNVLKDKCSERQNSSRRRS